MGLFGKKSGDNMMDAIRCDQKEYLIWKWASSSESNSTKRANTIPYGCSLNVKDGELAVFIYTQKDNYLPDFITGPYNQTIKAAYFPVLSSIAGSAFGNASPFQAEIYFINLSGNIQLKFGIPYFDVYDPRFLDFAVPIAVRGTITFNITDYLEFIRLNRLISFELDDFKKQIKDAVTKYVKGVITNIPAEFGIPVLQIERKLLEINDLIAIKLKTRIETDFGVNLKGFDLAAIEIDKESEGYAELRKVTAELSTKTTIAQADVNIKNLQNMQIINATNMEENLRIQREEAQRAQKLQTESNFIKAHALNQQTEILKIGAENLGNIGNVVIEEGEMNAVGNMLGSAMGNQIAGMMNQMTQNPDITSSPIPEKSQIKDEFDDFDDGENTHKKPAKTIENPQVDPFDDFL